MEKIGTRCSNGIGCENSPYFLRCQEIESTSYGTLPLTTSTRFCDEIKDNAKTKSTNLQI